MGRDSTINVDSVRVNCGYVFFTFFHCTKAWMKNYCVKVGISEGVEIFFIQSRNCCQKMLKNVKRWILISRRKNAPILSRRNYYRAKTIIESGQIYWKNEQITGVARNWSENRQILTVRFLLLSFVWNKLSEDRDTAPLGILRNWQHVFHLLESSIICSSSLFRVFLTLSESIFGGKIGSTVTHLAGMDTWRDYMVWAIRDKELVSNRPDGQFDGY